MRFAEGSRGPARKWKALDPLALAERPRLRSEVHRCVLANGGMVSVDFAESAKSTLVGHSQLVNMGRIGDHLQDCHAVLHGLFYTPHQRSELTSGLYAMRQVPKQADRCGPIAPVVIVRVRVDRFGTTLLLPAQCPCDQQASAHTQSRR